MAALPEPVAVDAQTPRTLAAPGVPIGDTIKEIDAAGRVVSTPERARLRGVQTPQAFSSDASSASAATRSAAIACAPGPR